MFEGFSSQAIEYFPILMEGAWTTIGITLCALVIGTLLGLVWALLRVSNIRLLAECSRYLTNAIRGIPIIVVLFYLYFVLPEMGVDMSAFQAGALGLGLAYSAYMAEVFRSGIEAIDPGQREAAQSIG
ncbi:MAG: ABC transporter permease subunit, partial [Proteobacteria bacterium]